MYCLFVVKKCRVKAFDSYWIPQGHLCGNADGAISLIQC